MISVKDLHKYYRSRKGDHHVLKGVSFEVAKGGIFCLLGSNGAGKTTAVNILTTLGKPDRGSASINGCDVVKYSDRVRESISLTGQYAATDELLTGRENLQMIADLRRVENSKAETVRLLQAFRLEDAADKPVSDYSGGMRRRLDIAMTLMGNSPVIFLDEPTTGLDPQNRIAMWELIRTMANDGVTIFLTTQYLEEAEQLANQVAILHEGVIIAQGSPEELKQDLYCEETDSLPTLEDVFLTHIGEK
ncbi:MAG: ATP-binding cassette domain-containing protein [Coriobacteriia bacterium]|nr:ATP-binding cassette domain-containing protein [Coriobacteriia bacterium]MCL2746371.1 ATP-binding cassette domain-containing protein [Coriobacteriia bacterium]MCL2870801.1 ATP-binding cassette domain-containing protein [Coriobacteriia bacterium]